MEYARKFVEKKENENLESMGYNDIDQFINELGGIREQAANVSKAIDLASIQKEMDLLNEKYKTLTNKLNKLGR